MKNSITILVLYLPIFAVADPAENPATELPSLLVTGKAEDLLGEAESASEGTVSAADLLNQAYSLTHQIK